MICKNFINFKIEVCINKYFIIRAMCYALIIFSYRFWQNHNTRLFFFIRTSKFCQGSLFVLNFWLLQPKFILNLFLFLWAVWNDEKSKQKDKALKSNADRLYFQEISDIYPRSLTAVHFVPVLAPRLQRSIFFCCPTILYDSVNFNWNIFIFSSLSLSLFLNCS